MRRSFVVVALLLFASRAGAPPPLGGFPDVLLPADGTTAPRNAQAVVCGENRPALDNIGLASTRDGDPNSIRITELGDCLLISLQITPEDPVVDGDVLTLLVSTAGSEIENVWTAGAFDNEPPELEEATLLDDSDGLLIGCVGFDEGGLAGCAVVDDDLFLVQIAPDDRLLHVQTSACVDVVALDLAGLISLPPITVCPEGAEGEGEEGEGEEGEGEGEAGGCASFYGSSVCCLLVLLRRRRGRA